MARSLVYAPESAENLLQLYGYIAEHSGPERARGYVGRIEAHCISLAEFSEQGRRRDDDLRAGLRITGFERRVSIAFHVTAETGRPYLTLAPSVYKCEWP